MKNKKLIKMLKNGATFKPGLKGCEECEDDIQSQMSNLGMKERVWEGLLSQKKILLNGEINESLIEKAVIQIFQMNEFDKQQTDTYVGYQPEPIKIFINTSGGTLDEAFSLVSAIEASTTPVVTIALGKAYSAGFLILLAGHARFAQTYSTIMLHQGSAGIGGEFSKVIEYAEHWKKCQGIVDDYIIRKTKIKRKQLSQIFNNRQDLYLDTTTAIELGCIDGIWKY